MTWPNTDRVGLALEVTIDENGSYYLSGVWDRREDGICYAPDTIDPLKVRRVEAALDSNRGAQFRSGPDFDKDGIRAPTAEKMID